MRSNKSRIQLSPKLRLGIGRKTTKNTILKYAGSIFLFSAAILSVNTLRLFINQTNGDNVVHSPQVLGISSTQKQPESSSEQFTSYIIKKGDTLFNIAEQHSISWTTLATLNNLTAPFTVTPGQTLKIPTP